MARLKRNPDGKPATQRGLKLTLADGASRVFSDLVLDFNGTTSRDGILLPGLADRLRELAKSLRITVLTSDTFGNAKGQLKGLPVEVRIVRTGLDKADFVRERGSERVIAIGNGRNDVLMLPLAGLGIAVIGPEGAAGDVLRAADIVVTDIHHALDLISHPLRVRAGLRE